MLSSRDINNLRPDVAANCRVFLGLCKEANLHEHSEIILRADNTGGGLDDIAAIEPDVAGKVPAGGEHVHLSGKFYHFFPPMNGQNSR